MIKFNSFITFSITFSLPVAMIGNEMNTRSDTIQDNLILLGSQSVVTTPLAVGLAVVFECEYDLSIDVASQDSPYREHQ